jgi:hypothetical protein
MNKLFFGLIIGLFVAGCNKTSSITSDAGIVISSDGCNEIHAVGWQGPCKCGPCKFGSFTDAGVIKDAAIDGPWLPDEAILDKCEYEANSFARTQTEKRLKYPEESSFGGMFSSNPNSNCKWTDEYVKQIRMENLARANKIPSKAKPYKAKWIISCLTAGWVDGMNDYHMTVRHKFIFWSHYDAECHNGEGNFNSFDF